jgi:cold-inducible RNA-binding protein
MEVKLYVGNLNDATTEQELRLLFAQAGTVTSVNLIQDRQTGQAKVFAYVSLSSQAEAQTAISLFNSFSVAGRALIVKTVKTPNPQGRDSGRLSVFASPGRQRAPRQTKAERNGYQSRLSAFGGGASPVPPHRRGAGKPD